MIDGDCRAQAHWERCLHDCRVQSASEGRGASLAHAKARPSAASPECNRSG